MTREKKAILSGRRCASVGVKLIARNQEAVRQASTNGQMQHLDTASEEITDEFLLFAIESGLLAKWAEAFPECASVVGKKVSRCCWRVNW